MDLDYNYVTVVKRDSEYWDNITKMYKAQRAKGQTKYGKTLEENTARIEDRIAYLQEEMVDGLMYCEWVKEAIKNLQPSKENDFDIYQKKAMRTMDNKQTIGVLITQACLGMGGEVGEVCNLWEKHYSQGHSLVEIEKKITLELGDILWYLTLCCEALGVGLADVANANIAKLEKRYKDTAGNVSFSTEKSERRKDVDG